MKALAKLERAPGLTLTRVRKPEVGHNDVMIRIAKRFTETFSAIGARKNP